MPTSTNASTQDATNPTTHDNTPPMPDDWWKDETTYRTWEQFLHGYMTYKKLTTPQQVADLTVRYDPEGKGVWRSTIDNLRSGRSQSASDKTIRLLSQLMGIPEWRLMRVVGVGKKAPTKWRVPPEVDSPFLNRNAKYALSDLVKGMHEIGADAWVAGHVRGQHDLIARLEAVGVDVTGFDEHVVAIPAAMAIDAVGRDDTTGK